MTQGGYQVIIILPIKSKMAAAKKRCFLRFPYLTESSPPSFKVCGLQMTTIILHNLFLVDKVLNAYYVKLLAPPTIIHPLYSKKNKNGTVH